MSTGRQKRRANQPAVEPKHRSVRGLSSVSAQGPPSGSPLSIAKSAFSGRALWISLALIVVNVVVYAPVWNYGFVNWDDPPYVTENPHVLGGLTWQGVAWAFTTEQTGNWHPLTWLSHMLDVQLYGMNAGGHHLTNLLLHIATTILLFGLLHRMTGALGRSAFVGGLFAVHPLHVESVAWVAERKDVLSTLLWMLTLWAYVGYVRRPRLGRYLVVFLLFALGLMAKPMLVTLPFVLLLLDVWPLNRMSLGADSPGRSGLALLWDQRSVVLRLVWEKLPLLALTVASSIGTFVVQRRGGAVFGLDTIPLSLRAGNALVSYVEYIGKMLWPAGLAVLYPYPRSLPGWWVAGAILGLIGGSLAVIWAARRHPYLPVGWLWYLGTLVPVIGLVQVGNQAMADRYSYVPLLGLFLMVGWGIPELLAHWPDRSRALPAAAVVAILACAITAGGQVQYWKSSIALWGHTLEVTTENSVAHNFLGNALANDGKISEAIVHYSEALRIKPDFVETHNNLGIALGVQGKSNEAMAHFSEALRINPRFEVAHNNLGVALANQGRIDEAIREFLEALRIAPDQADWHYYVAVMFNKKGETSEAIRHLEATLKLNPKHEEARRMLDNLTSQGRKPGPGTP